jgi:hypothetical protein
LDTNASQGDAAAADSSNWVLARGVGSPPPAGTAQTSDRLSADDGPEKSKRFPFADQPLAHRGGLEKPTGSSGPPTTFLRYRLNGPFLVEEKTISLSSGDHAGSLSVPVSEVKRVVTPRSTSISQTSDVEDPAPKAANAICF